MGKSIKKNPIIKDGGDSKKEAKKLANHTVRQKLKSLDDENTIASGNAYKKVYNSWNITDFKSRWTEQDAIDYYNNQVTRSGGPMRDLFLKKYPTLEKWLNHWKKTMLRK